ncbi:MAG TPA: heme A synthase, partial [Myxococcales bacterium]|nr:heme A synthase [Myxococcales bacterium]
LVAVIMQIMLGGWTSSNYAALACTDFPTCGGHWIPPDMNFSEAFIPWRGLGIDYEGGILDSATRMAIHFSHRIGAVVVFCFAALLSIRLWKQHARVPALCLLGLLLLQWGLGISNVVFNLPVLVAAAHNGVAALLLLTLVSFLYFSWNTPSRETHYD